MKAKDWADKLIFVPVGHIFSIWYYRRQVNVLADLAAMLVLFVHVFIWSCVYPYVPELFKRVFFIFVFYTLGSLFALTEKKIRDRKSSSK